MKTILSFLFCLLLISLKLHSQSAAPSLANAEKFFQQKEYSTAYQEYERAYNFYKENGKTTEMLEALFQMGRSNSHHANWDETLEIFERLELEAKSIDNVQMIGKALDAQISLLMYFKRMEEAAAKLDEMLQLEGMTQNLYSNAYNNLGRIKTINGQLDESYQHFLKAYLIDSTLQDSSSLPFSLTSIAQNLEQQGNYNKAIETYLRALTMVPARDSFKLPTFYFRLGILFLDLGNTKKSEKYLTDAMNMASRMKHKSTYAKCLLYMGHLSKKENNLAAASEYYTSALAKFEEQDNPEFQFYAINGLGSLALKNNNLTTAADYLKQAEPFLEKLDGRHFKNTHLTNSTAYHIQKGNWSTAKKQLDEAMSELNDFERINFQIQTYELARDYYAQQGDYKNAFLYQNKFQNLQDSILKVQKAAVIYDLEAQYQKAEQDLAIAELDVANKEQTALLNQKNRTIILGSVGLLTLSLLGAMGFYLYRVKRKTAEELAEKNNIITKALADKELLLREIHHRVKNNLQVISSLLRLQSKYIKDDKALSALNEGRNRVQSMALIHQNLYQDDNLMGIEIKDYFEKLIQSLFDSYKISESRISLHLDIDPMTLDVDTVVPLGLIVNELVSNTFKHAFPENRSGALSISLKETTHEVLKLTVSDDGVGMAEITTSTNQDSFGYKMIRAFQQKLDAELEVTSNNGTTVEVSIGDFKRVA